MEHHTSNLEFRKSLWQIGEEWIDRGGLGVGDQPYRQVVVSTDDQVVTLEIQTAGRNSR